VPNIPAAGVDRSGNTFGGQQKSIDKLPNECPICGRNVIVQQIAVPFVAIGVLELYSRCPNFDCSRGFISLYRFDPGRSQGQPVQHFNFERSIPLEARRRECTPEIAALSPMFEKIAAQAQRAEDNGLEEIAGPGFRKALEFLIKDYAISLQIEDKAKEDIKKIQLGNVIAKYLSGEKLPVVSKRAAWLGNDETHYERRWVGKDLEDLKKLIAAVEHFIAMEVLVKELPAEMPDPASVPKA
jgi:hypothetical protein